MHRPFLLIALLICTQYSLTVSDLSPGSRACMLKNLFSAFDSDDDVAATMIFEGFGDQEAPAHCAARARDVRPALT